MDRSCKGADNMLCVSPDGKPTSMLILETEKLKKTYKLGKLTVTALDGVDLNVELGDFVAILGPSGSGKSTLLNMLGALDLPTSGSVKIDQVDISKMNDNDLSLLRRKIGIVFQFFNLIERLDAIENVELPLSITDVRKEERRRRATELLELVGLEKRTKHKPNELSGGERQRVAIARALVNDPKFLLLDEPTGNIDSRTAKEVMELISQLNIEKKVTTVLVTHDRRIAKFAYRVLHLLDGKITKESG
jgi:putative ABC transport system ATP-binding protein